MLAACPLPLAHSVLPVDAQLPHVWLPAFVAVNAAAQWATLRSVALLAEEVVPRMRDAAVAGGMAHAYEQIENVRCLAGMRREDQPAAAWIQPSRGMPVHSRPGQARGRLWHHQCKKCALRL